jgi:hypothetical protein
VGVTAVIIKVVGRGPGGPAYNVFAYDAGQEILATDADELILDDENLLLDPEEVLVVEARKVLVLPHNYIFIYTK